MDASNKSNVYLDNFNLVLKINSYMIAIVSSGSFIAVIFNLLGIIEENFYSIIVIFSFSISIMSSFFLSKFRTFQINKRSFILVLGVLMLFLITYLRYDNYYYLNESLTYFLFYGMIIFLMVSMPFSYEKVLRGTSMLSLLILLNPYLFFNEFITEAGIGTSVIGMGLSYSLLTIITAGILHMFFYIKEGNFVVKISYVLNLILFILLLAYSTRGVLIALIILIYALIFTLIKRKFRIIKNIIVSFSLIIMFFIIFYIKDLLLFVYNYLLDKDIEINAITKSIYKMNNTSGLSGGRTPIYETVLQFFSEKPFVGNGIGYYAYYSGGSYPHNLVLQLLLETGVFITIPILIIILIGIKISFSSIDKYKEHEGYKIFITFCLVSSLPRLMFSSQIWEEPMFWLFIFSVLGYNVKNFGAFKRKA